MHRARGGADLERKVQSDRGLLESDTHALTHTHEGFYPALASMDGDPTNFTSPSAALVKAVMVLSGVRLFHSIAKHEDVFQ